LLCAVAKKYTQASFKLGYFTCTPASGQCVHVEGRGVQIIKMPFQVAGVESWDMGQMLRKGE